MTSLAGLQEQLDILQSHWTNVQQCAKQSPGRHHSGSTGQAQGVKSGVKHLLCSPVLFSCMSPSRSFVLEAQQERAQPASWNVIRS